MTINLPSFKRKFLAIVIFSFAFICFWKIKTNQNSVSINELDFAGITDTEKCFKTNSTKTSRLFEDEYFKVNLNQFKRKNLEHSIKSFRSGKTPKFLLVTKDEIESNSWKFELRHIFSNECPLPCKITGNINETSTADAIVLYLKHLKDRHHVQSLLPNRNYRQPWIMLTLESPLFSNTIYKTKYAEFNDLFNRTMMYRKDADIIVNHGFVVSKEDAAFLPFHWRIPPKLTCPVIYKPNRTLIGALISNCEPKSGRDHYINELQKFIKVDIYGLCGSFKCGHSMYGKDGYNSTTDKCLKKVGTNYMFYLAFENSFCTDYGTEKIYNLLYYPIVPIVFGGINYKEILPPHSFINAADFSPFKLANYTKFLAQNPREYNKYLEWRKHYISSTIGGESVLCDLCTKLYDPEFYEYKVINDFNKWFLLDSKCERKWTPYNYHSLNYQPIRC